MYRQRVTSKVLYGRFNDYLQACEEMNEIARERGWSEATFWTPTFGVTNEFVVELEYPDLATFEEQSRESYADPEFMKLLRSTAEMVEPGSVRTELLETAPELA
ncbi:MAG: NIPSNAP family protein [Actinomycetota bacterium]